MTEPSNKTLNSNSLNYSSLTKGDLFTRNINNVATEWFTLFFLFLILVPFMLLLGRLGLVFIGIYLILGIWLYLKLKQAKKKHEAIFSEFARNNSFTYTAHTKDRVENGTLYSEGHSREERDVLEGTFLGTQMKLSDYHYETGGGKSRRTYNIRVMRLQLPRRLPHMVIDCLVEPGESGSSTLPIRFDESQRLNLEGDFYKYFALYAPDKYAISALSVIAPDAMMALLRMKSLCDIEIIDNYIYFYWPETKKDPQSYMEVFNTVEGVMSEIQQKLSKGNIFATADQAKVHAESSRGVRLEKRFWNKWTVAIVVVFALMFMASFIHNESLSIMSTALYYSFIFGTIGFGIYQSSKRSRLRKQLSQRYHNLPPKS